MNNKKQTMWDRVIDLYCELEDADYCHLNVKWVAEKLGVTPSHLSRTFRKEKKWSIRRSIEYEKMSKAGDLLIGTDMSVSEIAAFLDYSSPAYFSRKFLDTWSIPATEFRVVARKEYEEFKAAEQAKQIKPAENLPTPPPLPNEPEEPLIEIIKKRFKKYLERKKPK